MVTVAVAEVLLWGRRIGAVAWDADRAVGRYEYDPAFLTSGIEVAPQTMPLGPGIFQFPELARETYRGLPGLLADSLPDRFGNMVIDLWLRRQGRSRETFTPIDQLLYIGTRGMGALEYRPPVERSEGSVHVDIDALADLAADVLAQRLSIRTSLDDDGVADLFRVGTSAGGARAKALIAWNPDTNEVRSGQVEAPDGFEPWLLKFDGVGSSDRDLADPQGFGAVEYAYHRMATAAGITMTECRTMGDASGRVHFMTRRFDRTVDGHKLHVQTLAGIAHYDFNQPGRYGYEDAFGVARRLGVPAHDIGELNRRMVFNVVARNHDDHTKNISFAMNRRGEWRLTPAYDVMWAYNPAGDWTARHQMTINSKRDGFTRSDLVGVGLEAGVDDADAVFDEVVAAVRDWPTHADVSGVEGERSEAIAATHRLTWQR
ncbi:MAG: type II toxin-antitoxin system HipA family toxin [Acidimicrobiia bacterium]